MQEEKVKKRESENNEEKEEEKRPKQQFDKDYVLEPFEGVGSEYMEMSMYYITFIVQYYNRSMTEVLKTLLLVEKMWKIYDNITKIVL